MLRICGPDFDAQSRDCRKTLPFAVHLSILAVVLFGATFVAYATFVARAQVASKRLLRRSGGPQMISHQTAARR